MGIYNTDACAICVINHRERHSVCECVCSDKGEIFCFYTLCCLLLYVLYMQTQHNKSTCLFVDGDNGEEESASVCDFPGADRQDDKQCCVRNMC